MLGEPTPNEADPSQWDYAFEKGTEKATGGSGYADVWKRDFFAWEYKGKRKNLGEAYQQLFQYREALENPPLLIVSDLHNFEVHTNFTSTAKEVHRFTLEDLRDDPTRSLDVLRAAMSDPDRLHPLRTPDDVTQEGAARFADLAESLQAQGYDAERVARFLNRVLFCLFAEDIGLLPNKVFTRLVQETLTQPKTFSAQLADLFHQMGSEGVTYFGTDPIDWFNGGLFGDDDSLELSVDEVEVVGEALKLDWSQIEPAILGTLFERELNPAKRGRLGVHYTDRESIERIVEPVVLAPLRREFEVMQLDVDRMLARSGNWRRNKRVDTNPLKRAEAFLERLRAVTVLDPACGSGNFLYVTLLKVKDLEKEVGLWVSQRLGIAIPFPRVDPAIVRGIELDPYAAELARVSVWIGHIQWMLQNGFDYRRDPVLQPLRSVELRDAILAVGEDGKPSPAEWPEAEFVVGNPPFLGGKRLRSALGDEYVEQLFAAWDGAVPREADLVCYWHEKVRSEIENGRVKRAGLIATNSIRGGANRRVLDRVKVSGDIFIAWGDEPWVVEGAQVRVAIVGQDDGSEEERHLDGRLVREIHADLSARILVDLTEAERLAENSGVSFMGDTKGGSFELNRHEAHDLIAAASNVNGRPNSDVVVPWVNGMDVTRRSREMFIVDFGTEISMEDAARYEAPYQRVRDLVRPRRLMNRREIYRHNWWRHSEPRPAMRQALRPLRRFIVTPRVAKHRLFVWLSPETLPDSATIAIARSDDYSFGVLHSRTHELWSLALGSSLGKGNDPRYTPTSTFETFPFPWPLNTPVESLSRRQAVGAEAIADEARELDEVRRRWLNPPNLVREEPDLVPSLPKRLVPRDDDAAAELAERTLTALYNLRPTWLDLLHKRLDEAVLAAYGWPVDLTDDEILGRLLALNLKRAEG